MKKGLYFLVLFLFIFSCSVNKSPVFIKVDNLKLISVASDTIRLSANAFFENPNDVGGKISTDEIKVIVNDTEVAQVSSDEFKVPVRSEFQVPLKVVIPTHKIFGKNKNGILGGLLKSVFNKSIKIQFKGEIKYKVLGFSSTYPIDQTQDLKIKF
ncbi:LEA type 2 family protein [uncultured Polaribacter sp.]|uniref:LEA type 2 family protein n=1 Tax=uncultured Polaribacter sp. TaxID=174711 RepID=UPI00262D61A7|nr:LEA type 2 family protein [uncultured Polaribacter sp.]